MRSTPWPKLILRTVKVPCGPLHVAMTMSSKAWRRSFSPSRILTWTRTVSPGPKEGWSVRSSLAASFCIIGCIDIDIFLFETRTPSLSDIQRFLARICVLLRAHACKFLIELPIAPFLQQVVVERRLRGRVCSQEFVIYSQCC